MEIDPAILPYVDDPAFAHIRHDWHVSNGEQPIEYIVAEARNKLHRETNQQRKAGAEACKRRKEAKMKTGKK